MERKDQEQKKNFLIDWFIRFFEGILVGIGFITPGLSGGVMAVVFGIYEPLMRFLGNLREKFIQNSLYFLPVGIGGVIGVVAFSAVVDFAFSNSSLPYLRHQEKRVARVGTGCCWWLSLLARSF